MNYSRIIIGLLSLTLVLFIGIASSANLEVHQINVGQGDAELIISPTGKKMLIDAGNNGMGTSAVLPYLNSLGITTLDYVVATHYHSDHIGGLDEVVNGLGGSSKINVAAYDRGGSYSSTTYTDYVNAVGSKRSTIAVGQIIDLGGGVTVKCLATGGYVEGAGRVYTGTDENTLSVVLLLKYNEFEMFLGGDVTSTIEPNIASVCGNVDVYKVSHHGSYSASSPSFINVIAPEVSFIAVGNGNTYGHPHTETITTLVNANSYIYQTETGSQAPPAGKGQVANGTFKLVTDGYSYTVSGASLSTITRNVDVNYIVFSEVLYDAITEPAGEWVELYNPTYSTVNIGGWTITDNAGTFTIPTGTTIASNTYLVIANSSSEFQTRYGFLPDVSGFNCSLSNTGDYLTLKNSSGTIIDRVAWGSGGSSIPGWGSTSQPTATETKTIVRANFKTETNTYADWLSNQTANPQRQPAPTPVWTNVSYTISSPHNYPDNYSYTWTITHTGAQKMKVYFSKFTTESSKDYVYIYDKNNVEIAKYSGSKSAFWSAEVTGDVIKIKLTSNSSINYYGFDISQYSWYGLPGASIDIVSSKDIFEGFKIGQNYPNPFNPQTTIPYTIAEDRYVSLKIYSSTGELVKTLVDGERNKGEYNVIWDGRDDRGNIVPAGVYIYRFVAGSYYSSKKMMLIK